MFPEIRNPEALSSSGSVRGTLQGNPQRNPKALAETSEVKGGDFWEIAAREQDTVLCGVQGLGSGSGLRV